MTRADFETRFNALFDTANPPSMDAIAAFRTEALNDYQTAEAAATTMSTLQTNLEHEQALTKTLQETNYKLFLMNPHAFEFNNENSNTPSPTPPPSQSQPPSLTMADIQGQLFESPSSKGD